MEIESLLSGIFKKIDISWLDNSTNLNKSQAYRKLISVFPNLRAIFQEGLLADEEEYHRTLKHIFRVFKIYFLLKEGKFIHNSLSPKTLELISKRLNDLKFKEILLLILILMYHDIGKFFNRKNHPNESFLLILKNNLLEPFDLSEEEKLLIGKVIQYHLLFATIYTGESTFYGIYTLLHDPDFIRLIEDEKNINRFLQFLEIFTIIDILGYPYTNIFDHYLKYYNEIKNKLRNTLNCFPDKTKALKVAKEYSNEWLEWRIAGALRIFQFVETKPHLTKNFYFDKLKESIQNANNNLLAKKNWNSVRNEYLVHTYKIQLKYSLALLMILAFGSFKRMGLKIDTGISYKLLLFWNILSREVQCRTKKYKTYLWNVFFEYMPHWSKINKAVIEKFTDKNIEILIENSRHEIDSEKEEFNLYLDFRTIL